MPRYPSVALWHSALKDARTLERITRFQHRIMLTDALPRNGNSSLSPAGDAASIALAFKSLTKACRAKGCHNVAQFKSYKRSGE